LEDDVGAVLFARSSRGVEPTLLLDGRIDAGVCALQPVPAGIVAEALPPVPIVCVARPDHSLASRAPASYGLAQLAGGLAVFEWSEEVADLEERLRIAGAATRSPATSRRVLQMSRAGSFSTKAWLRSFRT
jgi:DNA-binding transcriptional LysR family regulator